VEGANSKFQVPRRRSDFLTEVKVDWVSQICDDTLRFSGTKLIFLAQD
jgi:hypothetical protein